MALAEPNAIEAQSSTDGKQLALDEIENCDASTIKKETRPWSLRVKLCRHLGHLHRVT
jgi:hypothetical protein